MSSSAYYDWTRGWRVNHKRVERVMRAEGLAGLAPRKRVRTTVPGTATGPSAGSDRARLRPRRARPSLGLRYQLPAHR